MTYEASENSLSRLTKEFPDSCDGSFKLPFPPMAERNRLDLSVSVRTKPTPTQLLEAKCTPARLLPEVQSRINRPGEIARLKSSHFSLNQMVSSCVLRTKRSTTCIFTSDRGKMDVVENSNVRSSSAITMQLCRTTVCSSYGLVKQF